MPEQRARQRADDSAFAGPRSPAPRARGGASDSRRATLKSCYGMMVRTRHRTCGLCWCQPSFALFSLPSFAGPCVRMRAAPHRTLG